MTVCATPVPTGYDHVTVVPGEIVIDAGRNERSEFEIVTFAPAAREMKGIRAEIAIATIPAPAPRQVRAFNEQTYATMNEPRIPLWIVQR